MTFIFDVYGRNMAIALLGLNVKVISQGQGLWLGLAMIVTCSIWPPSWIEGSLFSSSICSGRQNTCMPERLRQLTINANQTSSSVNFALFIT